MNQPALAKRLQSAGIGPTSQRLRIAEVLLSTPRHLSADQVLAEVNHTAAAVSKATVYNTLRLFSERGLVREIVVNPDRVFYDSSPTPHHHFYNADTGELTDIPAETVTVSGLPPSPEGTEPEQVEVIVRIRQHASA
ncbi:MAG TPA: Fur family transcriptional regulator [Gammaproteobacteria bacterium]|nr:Fur family transcriptional regulator [Gammaproteobacteria bacterium]